MGHWAIWVAILAGGVCAGAYGFSKLLPEPFEV